MAADRLISRRQRGGGQTRSHSRETTFPSTLAVVRRTAGGLIFLAGVVVISGLLLSHRTSTHNSQEVLIAVGDSYAAGYQPQDPSGAATLHGFVDRLAPLLEEKHPPTVLNFACSGATTASVAQTLGCTTGARANNSPPYTTTQLTAATQAVSAHADHISAIVVALGANDFARCASEALVDSCISSEAAGVELRLRRIITALRNAAGPSTPIVGITYPNVGLIAWLAQPPRPDDAVHAQQLIAGQINPAIFSAYKGLAIVADVTTASGGLDRLPSATGGPVPPSVTKLCQNTWMCTNTDLHLTDAGQDLVAHLIAQRLSEARG